MEGITRSADRIDMEKPYLSVRGIDWLGHARMKQAHEPLESHVHPGCMEITFVMDGVQIYCAEGREYQIFGGQGFISFLDQPHSSSGDFLDVGEIYWMQLNLTHPEDFLGLNPELSFELTNRLQEIDRHVFWFDRRIRELIKQVFGEFNNQGTTPLAIASLTYLIQLLLRTMGGGRLIQNRFAELEEYIDSHLGENIRIEDLSAVCQLSVSTLQHKFKDYFGRAPAEYINYRKIQRAKEMLLEGKTVTETAMLLGFNTSNYFATVFRKFNRMSPSQWTVRHGKGQGADRK